MVLRILQYFVNSQKLVDKLAESNFMKRIARFIVHKVIRAKALTEDARPERLEKTLKDIAEKLKDKKNKLDGDGGLGPVTMKDHSVIFLGSEPMKDKRVATRVLSYFTVPADRLPKRILLSFMPPLRSAPLVHVDFLGPCLAFVLLASILGYGHANKTPSAAYHRSPAQVLAMYCLSMPVVCYSLIRLGKSSITLLQISSLLGYSLYGYVFTLICTALLSDETNNTIFYLSTILFTGPSVLRICLLILLTIELPAARLLVCSAIAVIQVLFVVFLYFTFVHSSFAFVKH